MSDNKATVLMFFGNLLAFIALFFIRTYLMADSLDILIWIIPEIIAAAALGFVSQKIALRLHEKYGFDHKRYILAACFPPIAAAFGQLFYFDYIAKRFFPDTTGYAGLALLGFMLRYLIIDIIVSSVYFLVGEAWAEKRLKY